MPKDVETVVHTVVIYLAECSEITRNVTVVGSYELHSLVFAPEIPFKLFFCFINHDYMVGTDKYLATCIVCPMFIIFGSMQFEENTFRQLDR